MSTLGIYPQASDAVLKGTELSFRGAGRNFPFDIIRQSCPSAFNELASAHLEQQRDCANPQLVLKSDMVIAMKIKVMILTKIRPSVETENQNVLQESLTEVALAIVRKGTCELIRVQSHQKLLHCLRTFVLIFPLFCPHRAFFSVPCFRFFFF